MDSWVTDGFYSHFPSYSQQPTRQQELAKARQCEYQTFLSRVTPKKPKFNGKAQKRHTTDDKHLKRQKTPTKHTSPNDKLPKLDTNAAHNGSGEFELHSRFEHKNRFQDELETMDLPDIFNDQMIRERNQKLAEEKRLKNIQYQQELMKQIDQRRREKELQRAKDEEEEERLTKRVEEQLKSVRLNDDLESQRYARSQHKLINFEKTRSIVNHQQSKPPITVRSEQIEPNTFRSYEERKAQSDRGKENCNEVKRSDKDIYNYFTNSAQKDTNQLKDFRYSHYFNTEDLSDNEMPNSMSSFSYNTYPSKSIRHHDTASNHHLVELKRPMCNFCKHNRFLRQNQDETGNEYICDSCESQPICLSCRKEICVQCKRPTQEGKSLLPSRHLKQQNMELASKFGNVKCQIEPTKKPTYVRTDSFQPLISDDDESYSDLSSTDHKPFSFNIAESSVFHPTKSRINRRLSVSIKNGEVFIQPDSFEELKRITDEKAQRFAQNYSDIKTKKSLELKESRIPKIILNSNPKPIMNPQPISSPLPMRDSTRKLIEFAKELERGDNNIFQRTEQKHQIPSVQVNKVVQNSDTSTLTQLGAFKKQLQLDKLNL